jgi:hypothetical protein
MPTEPRRRSRPQGGRGGGPAWQRVRGVGGGTRQEVSKRHKRHDTFRSSDADLLPQRAGMAPNIQCDVCVSANGLCWGTRPPLTTTTPTYLAPQRRERQQRTMFQKSGELNQWKRDNQHTHTTQHRITTITTCPRHHRNNAEHRCD